VEAEAAAWKMSDAGKTGSYCSGGLIDAELRGPEDHLRDRDIEPRAGGFFDAYSLGQIARIIVVDGGQSRYSDSLILSLRVRFWRYRLRVWLR